MIDFVKIRHINFDVNQWLQNDLLDFPLLYSEKTSEIFKATRKVKYNNLEFRLIPNKNGYHAVTLGSLHKYFNNGKHNANDFHTSQLNTVINELSEKFSIDPINTKLVNLEIGINIELPISVKEFLNYIISTPNKRFAELNAENVHIGKVSAKNEYELKVYSKAEQTANKIEKEIKFKSNLLRIELKIKKSRYLNKLGIFSLADLYKPEKIHVLVNLLYDMFNDVIIYENNIEENKLTDRQLIYLLRHLDPLFWEGKRNKGNGKPLSKQNRYMHLKTFEKFLKRHTPQNSIKNFILSEIKRKENELINTWNNNFVDVKRFKPFTFSQYKCKVKKSTPTQIKEKTDSTKRVCEVCGKDISHKHPQAKYCSTQCKNKANNKKRTLAAQKQRAKELKELEYIKKILPDNNLSIQIFKKSDKKTTISRKKQKDIKPLKYRSLRKIIKVKIYINGKLYEFTTLRAKALIKYIYQLNIAEIEKYKCAECGKEFIPQRKDTKYCSKKCKNKVSNRNRDLKRKLLKMQI